MILKENVKIGILRDFGRRLGFPNSKKYLNFPSSFYFFGGEFEFFSVERWKLGLGRQMVREKGDLFFLDEKEILS